MALIDSTARVEDGAQIGDDVSIGPYCIIGRNVVIGDGAKLLAHVHLAGHTIIGARTTIYPFASLGAPPQSVHYNGEPTRLEIGADCTIREHVTMNTGTVKGGALTQVGERCMFMSYSHVAHDCIVGNDVTFANNATLGGHCTVGDFVFMGGLSAAHQFVRIGAQAMIGGLTGLRGDVIPYGFANDQHAVLDGLNVVGMKRRKFTRERLHAVRKGYRDLFYGVGHFADRVAAFGARNDLDPALREIVDFIQAGHKRPLCMARPKPQNLQPETDAGDE